MGWPKGKPRKAAIVPPSISTENTMPATAEVIDLKEQMAEMARMREVLLQEQAEVAALKAKLTLKAEIREEVSEAVMEQRRREFGKPTPATYVMPPKPDDAQMFAVKLEKNYAPEGYFETVGWLKPAVFKKKFGETVMIAPEEFIKGEKAPPTVAGTGYANKVWAGTTIMLPEAEAKSVVAAKIASRGFD